MEEGFDPYALVVDDDVLIRLDAVDILADAGFRTHEAGNVSEAITVLEARAGDIQLLFSDVQMPGDRNGFDLARECNEKWPHISILLASGQAQPRDGELPKGATFIGKPFSAQVIHDRLQELLPDGKKPEPLAKRAK
jgi:CheY-like chemotaxis protein